MELKVAEEGLDTFSNKGFFPTALSFLWEKNTLSYYDTFLSLGNLLKHRPPLSHPALFRLFYEWYLEQGLKNPEAFLEKLQMDFQKKNPHKPMF